ncbi:MAG: S8/S53 family peptidase [Pseudomonadota bacterium]
MRTHQKQAASWNARAMAVLLAAALAACGGQAPSTPAAQAKAAPVMVVADASQLAVTGITKVGATRVGRTVFDYVFRVSFRNNGSEALSAIHATLTAAGAGATIVDATVAFDAIGGGASASPADTITIRQDRSLPFDAAALVWRITASSTPPTLPGILLDGAPDSPAADAIPEYQAARTEADLASALDANGAAYYRTQLEAVIADNATVGQVNAALNSVAARLVWSMRMNRVVTLQVPDPGSLAALMQVAAALTALPGIESASVSFLPVPDELPPSIDPALALSAQSPILNHLGARMPPVWNARAAFAGGGEPELMVIDYFGQGNPTQLVSAASGANPSAFDCVATPEHPNPCTHGYHVIGIAAGSFGGSGPLGLVTGSLARALPLTVIDITRVHSGPPIDQIAVMRMRIAERVRANPDGKFVLNISLGARFRGTVQSDAFAWRIWARGIRLSNSDALFDWDNHVFTVASAGNATRQDARFNSRWSAAALLPEMISAESGAPVPPLTNTLVVEARDTGVIPTGVLPTCNAPYSNVNGDVGAIGGYVNGVYSFTSPDTFDLKNGTSMATPQVAGLVASMIAIRPQWPLADIKYRIESVRTREDTCVGSAPMIDAYAAVLALDSSLDDAPVRTALLKPGATAVLPAQQFTYAEALRFLQEFFPQYYGGNARPDTPDYSRFDLNGDGFTGGPRQAPFQLRFSRANVPFTPVELPAYPRGPVLPTPLNEAAVSDFAILCYYVQSAMMSDADRAAFDGQLAQISAQNPTLPRVSCAERAVTLRVNASNPNWTGLPAVITLANFVRPFPATFAGNSATCTNQGALPGERGAPLFSLEVPAALPIFAALDVAGMPSPLNGGAINRRNCSSFFATSGSQVWINATGRAVFGFGTGFVSDWEYQVRYTNGGPAGTGKKCTVGSVGNANFFFAAFENPSCTHEDAIIGIIRQ